MWLTPNQQLFNLLEENQNFPQRFVRYSLDFISYLFSEVQQSLSYQHPDEGYLTVRHCFLNYQPFRNI